MDDENDPSVEEFVTTESVTEGTTEKENETTERTETTEAFTETTEPDVESTTEPNEQSTEKIQLEDKNTESINDEFSPDKENECLNDKRKKIHTCLPTEPKTCKNMNYYKEDKAVQCKKGCACKDEYVFDEATNSCVEPTTCTCDNGGKKYLTDGRITKDCNECICMNAEWFCTNRKCDSENHNNTQQDSTKDKRETDAGKSQMC